jgi:hypothetical protein
MQKFFLVFLFLIGVVVSSIAGIFSVSGLTTVFKGATFSILLMGSSLEVAKVSVSIFLHLYHKKLNILLFSYLVIALIILMGITSLGVYGYLSKAFFNSTNTSGMVIAVKNIESKIEIQNSKIKNLRGEIDQLINLPSDEKKSWHTYRIQNLSKKIDDYSVDLEKYNNEYIEQRTKLNVLESEVGPLKYLAQFLYGDSEDAIGKAVQILIICLVIVFDPLAILLIISAIKGYEILSEKPVEKSSPTMEKILNNPIVSETLEIMDELSEQPEEEIEEQIRPISKKKAPQKYKKKEILEEKTIPLMETIKKINEDDLPLDAINMAFEEDEKIENEIKEPDIIIEQNEVPQVIHEQDFEKMYKGKPIVAGVFVD